MLKTISLLSLVLIIACGQSETVNREIRFDRMVIDSSFQRVYQIKSADIDQDGLLDILAVSDREPEIFWYKNPTWTRHLISDQTTNNIDLAP